VLDAELGGQRLLWVSPLLNSTPGHALRGGVPLCFPWFGKHPDGLPAHGFARNRDWNQISLTRNRAVFELVDDDATRALWPHRFRAKLAIELGDGLHFEFSVQNLDEVSFTFSYALHSYFAVADSTLCAVEGLEGKLHREVGRVTTPQVGRVQLDRPTDAIFERAPETIWLLDGKRSVQIDGEGMTSAVVWNPGVAGADVPDIGKHWREFVCVERGNVGASAITLQPRAKHVAGMRIRVG